MRRLCYTLALLVSFFVNLETVIGQKARGDNYRAVELRELPTFYEGDQRQKLKKLDKSFLLHIQFGQLPSKETSKRLEALGVKLHSYLSNNTYLASFPEQLSFEIANDLGIVAYGVPHGKQKLAKALLEKDYPDHCLKGNKVELAFNFYQGADKSTIKDLLKSYGVEILEDQHRNGYTITGLVDAAKVDAIAEEPAITFVDVVTPPVDMLNHEVRALQQVNYVNAANGKNLNGAGVAVGIGDGGELGDHLDFEGRVINYANGTYASFGDHGDHVAGIVGSAGTLNPRHRGMASEANLVIQKTSLITLYMPDYYANDGMVLTNNSYGTSFNCDLNGTYNYTSQTLDIQMRDYPEVLHVFAAGNSGNQTCSPYPAGYKTVLRYYQSAKNVLTVGNVDQNRMIKSNSSRGPVLDGRLKPEICGIGTGVYSTGRTFNYKSKSGTSMASPAVTGTLALLYESYRNENSDNNPQSGLIKAIACNTADDLGNAGPDYIYGYGLINARRSVETIEAGNYLSDNVSEGGTNTHTITIPSGTKQVKVMLYWHDKEAEPYPTEALVNDLDLVLTTPSSTDYLPWVLDHDAANVANLATRQEDHLNNIEQVTLDNPTAGAYTISISGYEVPFGPQDYFITYEFVTDDVVVTAPLGGEVFNPGDTEYIQWDVDASNTSTFTVEYSIDNGSSWILISNNVAADKRFYSWSVPSNFTEDAFVRVTKNDGSGIDENGVSFSIIEQPVILVEPICYGGVHLTWNAVAAASHYEVLMFDGIEMVYVDTTSSLAYTLEDPSLVLGEKYWFSVIPKTSSGKSGMRAIAKSCITQYNVLCPWPDDIFLEYVTAKTKGRFGTNTALSDAEPVSTFVKNTGNNSVSNFDVYYRINGGASVMETYNGTLASGDSLLYTFNQTVDMSTEGNYQVDVWANLANDVHNNNDSLLNTFQSEQLSNDPIVLNNQPLNVSFQTSQSYFYDEDFVGLDELDRWDFETVIEGTLNIGGASNSLELVIDNAATEIDPSYSNNAIFTVNLANHDEDDGLALDIVYSNNNLFPLEEGPELVNKLYVRGSDTDAWLDLYSMDEMETGWHTVTGLNVMNALTSGGQSLSSSVQIRFEENGKGLLVDSLNLYETPSLPVTLTKFVAERVGNDALLSWSTASEENNKYFIIEVAESEEAFVSSNFTSLGKVDGKGTVAELTDYTFVDKTPGKNGYRYYRLKQVDYDGKFTYSEVRLVKFFINKYPVTIYPNPAVNYVVIDFEGLLAKSLNIQIVDAKGVVVQNFNYEEADGVERLRLDILDHPAGVYYLIVTQDSLIMTYPLYKSNSND